MHGFLPLVGKRGAFAADHAFSPQPTRGLRGFRSPRPVGYGDSVAHEISVAHGRGLRRFRSPRPVGYGDSVAHAPWATEIP